MVFRSYYLPLLPYFTALLLLSGLPLFSDDAVPPAITGITVDLLDPEYADGVLHTRSGGVITAPDLRVQAQNITYTHAPHASVVAEGDVRLDLFGYTFLGRKIEYNILEKTGYLYDGHTGLFPWFFVGKTIQLCCDGSYIVYDGYVTTSEAIHDDWKIAFSSAILAPNHDLSARNISIKICKIPVFWMPVLNTNLDTITHSPVRYTMRLGGRQGSRVGMSYEFFRWGSWKGLMRLDYNFKRGLGGGIEAHYFNSSLCERFDCINYLANDCSLADLDMHTRYRLQGHYMRYWRERRTLVDLIYDKLSDQEMATDYSDRGIELDVALTSRLIVHHQQDELWIGNMTVRPRLNFFQTINQELPSFSLTLHPRRLFKSVVGLSCQASYLDFRYAHGLPNVRDFTATRCQIQPYIYLPLQLGPLNIVPRIDYVGIFYGNTPFRHSSFLTTAIMRCDAQLLLRKEFPCFDHALRPYISYLYITAPSLPPNRHFIFDIQDGWYRVNALRAGLQQHLIERPYVPLITLDTYVWTFLDEKRTHPIPRATADLSFFCFERLKNTLETTWDLTHGQLLHINFKSAWTVSDSLALRLEYRQRSAYDWRKVDRENFTLDFFRTTQALLRSPLSDARRTLLLHFYWYLRYDTALEWESRLGWNRPHERSYFEFDVNIHTTLAASWLMTLAYQHKEYDDRVAIYFSLAMSHPSPKPPGSRCSRDFLKSSWLPAF